LKEAIREGDMENTFKHKVHKVNEGNTGRGLNHDHGMVMVNGE
jgi:hypothetical protein